MGWREQILEYAEANSCTTIVDAAGVGLVYDDGCDVFWILPGEPGSTLPLDSDDGIDPTGTTTIRRVVETKARDGRPKPS